MRSHGLTEIEVGMSKSAERQPPPGSTASVKKVVTEGLHSAKDEVAILGKANRAESKASKGSAGSLGSATDKEELSPRSKEMGAGETAHSAYSESGNLKIEAKTESIKAEGSQRKKKKSKKKKKKSQKKKKKKSKKKTKTKKTTIGEN